MLAVDGLLAPASAVNLLLGVGAGGGGRRAAVVLADVTALLSSLVLL